jgi:UDP-N-acetylglucosamine--N-acetylmuramyl-(pentapeptide) pyrophosphoryl-undecaprenol N-acetylglucosamine transferase
MYLWISGGGTAGHVYPALTVLDASEDEAVKVRWIGTAGSIEERLVRARGLPFLSVEAAPLVDVGPVGFVRNALRILRGTHTAWRAMGADRPDVALVTGGNVSVPVSVAAWLRRLPLAVYLPDASPGRAVRLIARLADRILATTEDARRHLPAEKIVVTGYPVRDAVRRADRTEARQKLGLDPGGPVLLVFGGSQGARHINQAVLANAPALLHAAELVHVTGARELAAVNAARETWPDELRARHHVFGYLDSDDMAAALAAADLAVCRAGAATIGELPARALPAVVVPLPISRRHQDDNARLLAEAGAAEWLADEELDEPVFAATVLGLLGDPARRAAMAEAARRLDRPDAAGKIWRELVALAGSAA